MRNILSTMATARLRTHSQSDAHDLACKATTEANWITHSCSRRPPPLQFVTPTSILSLGIGSRSWAANTRCRFRWKLERVTRTSSSQNVLSTPYCTPTLEELSERLVLMFTAICPMGVRSTGSEFSTARDYSRLPPRTKWKLPGEFASHPGRIPTVSF